MKRILIFCLIVLLYFNCNNSNQKNNLITDEPAKVVIDFLNWYKINYDSVTKFILVKNSDYKEPDSTKLYRVNFQETENYLSFLNSSGFISEQYLKIQRKYFLECDSNFKANPEFEGPPDGFDYDFIMQSQDYENELKHPEKYILNSSKIKNDTAEIIFDTPDSSVIGYQLIKENNVWKIFSITNMPIKE